MSQRPSLLDDSDFSAIGSDKKSGRGGGGGSNIDTAKMAKIGVLVLIVALTALVYGWSYIAPERTPVGSDGKPIVRQEPTPEEEAEFERQQKRMELEVEQGRAVIGGA